jgi:penicillin amidase
MKKRTVIAPIVGVMIIVLILVMGSLTPLISILNPSTGVIQNSRDLVIGNSSISLPGLTDKVVVVQDKYGVFHFYAPSTGALYYALGFIQAKERLQEIEVFGLEGMGQMHTLFGNSYLNYDRFQTLTGAPVTAAKDWQSILNNASTNATDLLTKNAMLSYASGVNEYINYSEAHHTIPLLFKLLGVKPYYWTPVYSYAVQELMTQQLEFGDDGLQFAVLYNTLGNLTYNLLPTFSPVQNYYYGGYSEPVNQTVLKISHNTFPINSTVLSMAKNLLYQFRYDPPTYFNFSTSDHSNEIVVAGNRTTTGHPLLMGGPVLGFSLPAIWFQVQLVAPGVDVYGVVLPGAPSVIIGYNQNISWTLTDTQAISSGTFFFTQQIVGDSYIWNGTAYPLHTYRVNGFVVNWTNLGPIMEQNGSTAIVMDWVGNIVSNEIGVALQLNSAKNWTQFRNYLSSWVAPYQNFAFANSTLIADISPSYYPIFGGTLYNPASIMPGNGTEFISGSIPYDRVPQAVNPSSGFIVSSNQRQVGPGYPYWYGITESFSSEYRAQMEVNYLSNHSTISENNLINFQGTNYTDYQAQVAVPHILSYLQGSTNGSVERAYSLLKGWNYNMTADSLAASVWFFTYMNLFNNTFIPFLEQHNVLPQYNSTLGTPSGMGGSFPNTSGSASMDIDMLNAIITGTAAPFSNASMKTLTIESVTQAMSFLEERYPSGNYTWGKFYGFLFPNLFGLSEFNVGPISKGGDFNTPNDASGVGPNNYPTGGQSWEMVVNMSNVSRSYGVYPGGESENPASPLYSNYVNDWINGTYLPLLFYQSSSSFPQNDTMDVTVLTPEGGSL